MDKEELINNLGTIANSGSLKFIEEFKKQEGGADMGQNMIGQFGVGFYSAFIVGDTVEVFSRKAGGQAHCWTSNGEGEFQICSVQDFNLERGTVIKIYLKPEFKEFADKTQVKKVIDKYSNFIHYPIYLNHERVNVMRAIWARDVAKVTPEEYKQFY